MIGGVGERRTLRLVAEYADACNMFNVPDLAHKLAVLRAHCDDVGRDYDEIEKTVLFPINVGDRGERCGEVVDRLAALADMGIHGVISAVRNVSAMRPLELIGERIIPSVSDL